MKFKNWKNRVMEKVVAPMINALVKYTICHGQKLIQYNLLIIIYILKSR